MELNRSEDISMITVKEIKLVFITQSTHLYILCNNFFLYTSKTILF